MTIQQRKMINESEEKIFLLFFSFWKKRAKQKKKKREKWQSSRDEVEKREPHELIFLSFFLKYLFKNEHLKYIAFYHAFELHLNDR